VHRPRRRQDAAGEPVRARIVPSAERDRAQELVLGRYRVLERLGSGGFGVVWRARDELLHREVALKRVSLGPEVDGERASREALAAARLSHPAIVALHEACAHEHAFYLISELVDGETLAELIADDALADEEVLEIAVALAAALAHAHARGVIHRDIKPQNVLVPRGGEHGGGAHAAAKLTDFGGASLAGEDVLTRTGDVIGTLAYMAPEQSEGRETGAQADLYSLALVVYEALSGENPVRGATPTATARRIGRPLPPLARSRGDLPPALTRAIDRALAPEPDLRGTLEDLRGACEQALERGLRRRPWRRGRWREEETVPLLEGPTDEGPAEPHPTRPAPARRVPARPPRELDVHATVPEAAPPVRSGLALPRALWLACSLLLALWQASVGRPGVALLLCAALAPVLALPRARASRRVGAAWLAATLAPALGWIGLAGAFPAFAGQCSRWRERAALGALGYWWLALAQPLLGRDLWLAPARGAPARAVWERSLTASATHVIAPSLAFGVLLGALLWALAAAALPWLVRGRSAVRDVAAASLWSAALAAAEPFLDAGARAHASVAQPRGAVLGAILGALAAVAARALRGPV